MKLSQSNGEKGIEAWARGLLGTVLIKIDPSRYEEAEEHILQAIAIADEQQSKPYTSYGFLYLGEFYADAGQREKALDTLNKAKGAFREMGMDYWLRRTQEALERVEAS